MKLTGLQERWLQELESGRRKQCRMVMKTKINGECCFCCLGVAREIMVTFGNCFYLSGDESRKLGLFSPCGEFKGGEKIEIGGKVLRGLAEMNDSGLFTFQEIAAFIRKNPELVFNNGEPESC